MSLYFPELIIIGKYVKISIAIFSVLEVKRSKILQKLNKRLFLCTFLVLFFVAFLTLRQIYTNMRLALCWAHVLNKITY